jgi:hypothetical protein
VEGTDKGYRLASGREFYANDKLLSIARDADGTFRIGQGYDGTLPGATDSDYDEEENWTPEERRELADFMIAQWTAFKESI